LPNLGKRDKAYCLASKIWRSGKKKIVKIKSRDLELNSSPEHLVFANGSYKPALSLELGDCVRILKQGKVVESIITYINKTRTTVPMYDMEVPFSENFFANNIVCHNSRWFRYLFSTGTS